ncbi:MAG: hypothetical protein MZV70_01780 [Desulfobacterales bacterium]|nr:hypothetical protein [Desulfobacterales bacterium]
MESVSPAERGATRSAAHDERWCRETDRAGRSRHGRRQRRDPHPGLSARAAISTNGLPSATWVSGVMSVSAITRAANSRNCAAARVRKVSSSKPIAVRMRFHVSEARGRPITCNSSSRAPWARAISAVRTRRTAADAAAWRNLVAARTDRIASFIFPFSSFTGVGCGPSAEYAKFGPLLRRSPQA